MKFYPENNKEQNERNKAKIFYNVNLVDKNTNSKGAILVIGKKIEAVFKDKDLHKNELLEKAKQYYEKISNLQPLNTSEKISDIELINGEGKILTPSFIDLHVHFREPGFTKKETLETGSKAAAAGGYGTVVLMANTNPVISTKEAALVINQKIKNIGLIESYQTTSITKNFEGKDVSELKNLCPQSVPIISEDGNEVASSQTMLDAMKIAATQNITISCHCEDPSFAEKAKLYRSQNKLNKAEKILALAENIMTERNLLLAAEANCKIHIAHVSTEIALNSIRRAKKQRNKNPDQQVVTCETTPHHFALNDQIAAIVNPPLRSEKNRLAIIQGIVDGTIDAIATDHAPHSEKDKQSGAPGFSGIQTAFAVGNTYLVKEKIIDIEKLSELMSANPARILNLKKGLLKPNYDADLVLLDVNAPSTSSPENKNNWHSKSTNTAGYTKQLYGEILKVYKNGNLVATQKEFP